MGILDRILGGHGGGHGGGLNRHEFSRHSQAAGNTAFHIRPATSHC